MTLQLATAVLLASFSLLLAAPLMQQGNGKETKMADSVPESEVALAKEYLEHFYHLGEDLTNRTKRSADFMTARLKQMQAFFHLNATGTLDSQTLEIMKSPRCGVPDVSNYSPLGQQNLWSKNTLTYSISSYTSSLPSSTVNSIISSALKVWSDASPLSFVASNVGNADIIVNFARRSHGDSYAFDGPGGTLAHAFGPGVGIGGDTHFDEDENWSTQLNGFNLYLVAAHEFGHSLGLSHSSNPSSLMYPTYQSRSTDGSPLSNEDVQMVQNMYGTESLFGGNYYPYVYRYMRYFFPRRLVAEEKCKANLTFDAATQLGENVIFFKGRNMWSRHLDMSTVKEGLIKDLLPQMKSNIDAAYEVPSKKSLYVFKDAKFWTIKNLKARRRPTRISKLGFPAEIDHIDAAVYNNGTNKTLFFEGENIWSYDESTCTMDENYPKNITDVFPGIRGKLDAVFELRGFLHFIIGSHSLKFDRKTQSVTEVLEAKTWLGC
ncbi:matrix metalloproteinase-20-like [Lissotriton helveticus]